MMHSEGVRRSIPGTSFSVWMSHTSKIRTNEKRPTLPSGIMVRCEDIAQRSELANHLYRAIGVVAAVQTNGPFDGIEPLGHVLGTGAHLSIRWP